MEVPGSQGTKIEKKDNGDGDSDVNASNDIRTLWQQVAPKIESQWKRW